MVNNKTTQFRKAMWQIPVLILLALITAVCSNAIRSDSIPIIGDWSIAAQFSDAGGESLVVTLEDAGKLFKNNTVLFVDARSQSQYMEGHISGALNLPWQEVDLHFVKIADRLMQAEMIITYCDGESCDLSHELALFLKEMSFENVRVLVNGWTVWQQAGLPTQVES